VARSGIRLTVFAVLVAALLAVLLGRTAQLQLSGAAQAQQAADGNRVRELVTPPMRGQIVDQVGRPLAAHRQVLRVVLDRDTLYALPGDGAAVVRAVADLLSTSFEDLDARLTPCTSEQADPSRCWDGSLAEPIPVAVDVQLADVLPILEQADDYPGVALDTVTVRSYPSRSGERASHLLGRLGEATQSEVEEPGGPYRPGDVVGRGGLEEQYEDALRGAPGSRTVTVDTMGRVTATLAEEPAQPGATVVTSIDGALQAVVEEQLAAAVQRARQAEGADLPADSGAAVVVDVTDGRVLAMASYPDYQPTVFDGGISEAQYRALQEEGALLANPIQGGYPPGSTFKPFTAAAMASAGFDLQAYYPCPSSYLAGGRSFANFESRGYGTISLRQALEVSCNTVFYRAADQIWAAAGGESAGQNAADPIRTVAESFGLGSPTGIDLPGEVGGLISGRETKAAHWQDRRDAWCAAAVEGYPELRETDPELAEEYTALDRENCESGGLWRQGDAINAAIGQGLTTVTPLQVAMAYAAIANGGTRYQAQVAKAVVAGDGTVTDLPPKVLAESVADAGSLAFLREALRGVTERGSAAAAFRGFPLAAVPVAGKTGSAQVPGGRPATSWFASFAPADEPRYAVVLMVTQGGTGGGTSAPSVRAIYEALFGVTGGTADPARSVLLGGVPQDSLPTDARTAGGEAR
jgi:penicillin-binding protein 2